MKFVPKLVDAITEENNNCARRVYIYSDQGFINFENEVFTIKTFMEYFLKNSQNVFKNITTVCIIFHDDDYFEGYPRYIFNIENGKVIYEEVYFNGYSITPTMHNFSKLKEYVTFAECLIRNDTVRIDCDLTTDINIAKKYLVENQDDVLATNKLDIKRNAIDKFKEIL